jgi:F-type H+-transporting ATPase subunit delta
VNTATISRSYAEALFEVGRAHGEEEAYGKAFDALTDAFRAEPRMRNFFASPRIPAETKRSALEAALKGRVPARFVNFALLVLDRGRQRLLPEMAGAYQALLDQRSGRVRVEVTLARKPDAALEAMLGERLSDLVGQPVRPHVAVNPAIVGGLVVRYGDRLLDASLRRQIVALRRDMINARLPGENGGTDVGRTLEHRER